MCVWLIIRLFDFDWFCSLVTEDSILSALEILFQPIRITKRIQLHQHSHGIACSPHYTKNLVTSFKVALS